MRGRGAAPNLSKDGAHTILDIMSDLSRRVDRIGVNEVADRAGMTPERVGQLLRCSVDELRFRELQKLAAAVGARLEWRMNDEEEG